MFKIKVVKRRQLKIYDECCCESYVRCTYLCCCGGGDFASLGDRRGVKAERPIIFIVRGPLVQKDTIRIEHRTFDRIRGSSDEYFPCLLPELLNKFD